MATGTYAPVSMRQFFDNSGAVLNGGLWYFYQAGTTTAQNTWSDVSLATPNANPVVLDSAGRAGPVFFTASSYKEIMKTSAGVTLWTRDNVLAVPATEADTDIAITAGEALTATQVVYLSVGAGGTTAGRWYKADADAAATSVGVALAFVVTDIASGASGTGRTAGRMTGFTGLTAGSAYYVSGTAGGITATMPTNARFVGWADSTTSLVIAPNPDASTALDLLQIEALLG